MKNIDSALATGESAILRIVESNRSLLERLIFHRHPHREWGTFFQFGYRRTLWGLALTFVRMLPPQPGDLDRNSAIVSFRPDYISSALTSLEAGELGVGVVHSHPLGAGVTASPTDDDMDEYYANLFEPYGGGRPYVSLIANRDYDGQLFFSGRAYDRGVWVPVTDVLVNGRKLERLRSDRVGSDAAESSVTSAILNRWERLIGRNVCQRLRNAAIGIVGCSGTGSPAVEILARSQIGNFVVLDEQRADLSNLERIHGSRLPDVTAAEPPFKVELMKRMILEINPDANVTMFVGNVLDDGVLDELCRCDILIGCTDTIHGRARLSDLASLYLIPCLDVGVLPFGENGRVLNQHIDLMRMGSNDPCAYCRGRIDALGLAAELMTETEREVRREAAACADARGDDGSAYWAGEIPQLPAVGYLTTAAGALAAGYALNWLLGTSEMPHAHFQFDIGAPEFGFAPNNAKRRDGCSCAKLRGYSDQGERSVTLPNHFARAYRL